MVLFYFLILKNQYQVADERFDLLAFHRDLRRAIGRVAAKSLGRQAHQPG
jgi:hypothetical protein